MLRTSHTTQHWVNASRLLSPHARQCVCVTHWPLLLLTKQNYTHIHARRYEQNHTHLLMLRTSHTTQHWVNASRFLSPHARQCVCVCVTHWPLLLRKQNYIHIHARWYELKHTHLLMLRTSQTTQHWVNASRFLSPRACQCVCVTHWPLLLLTKQNYTHIHARRYEQNHTHLLMLRTSHTTQHWVNASRLFIPACMPVCVCVTRIDFARINTKHLLPVRLGYEAIWAACGR